MNPVNSSSEERADSMKENFNEMLESIRLLNSEVESLKHLHDQLVISFLQLQYESDTIRHITRVIKSKIEDQKHQNTLKNETTQEQMLYNNTKNKDEDHNVFLKEMISYQVTPTNTDIKLLYSIKTNSVVCAVSFDGTGDFFAFSNTKSVFLVNTIDGTLREQFHIPNSEKKEEYNPRALKISPNSEYVAIPGPDDNIIVYSISAKKIVGDLKRHENKVSSLLFSNDSEYLYSGGFDGRICIWNLNTMSLTKAALEEDSPNQEMKNVVVALTKDKDDETLAVGFINGKVGVSNMSLSLPFNTFRAHDEGQYLLDVSVSPLDNTMATTSHDKTTKIWSLRGVATCKKTLYEHKDMVLSVCFSPNSTICFTGSKDETFKCWNYKTGEMVFTMKAHKNTLFEITHHPTKNIIATCSGDEHVCIWEYNL